MIASSTDDAAERQRLLGAADARRRSAGAAGLGRARAGAHRRAARARRDRAGRSRRAARQISSAASASRCTACRVRGAPPAVFVRASVGSPGAGVREHARERRAASRRPTCRWRSAPRPTEESCVVTVDRSRSGHPAGASRARLRAVLHLPSRQTTAARAQGLGLAIAGPSSRATAEASTPVTGTAAAPGSKCVCRSHAAFSLLQASLRSAHRPAPYPETWRNPDDAAVLSHMPFTRRQFLGMTTAAAGAATGLYTWRVEPHWLEIVRRPLPVRGLPAALAGQTLAQVSDIHVGPRVDDDYVLDSFARLPRSSPTSSRSPAISSAITTACSRRWIASTRAFRAAAWRRSACSATTTTAPAGRIRRSPTASPTIAERARHRRAAQRDRATSAGCRSSASTICGRIASIRRPRSRASTPAGRRWR